MMDIGLPRKLSRFTPIHVNSYYNVITKSLSTNYNNDYTPSYISYNI